MRGYTHQPTGRVFLNPTSECQAIEHGKKQYHDVEGRCETCDHIEPLRWVGRPGSCNYCVTMAYNGSRARKTDEFVVKPNACKNGPHLLKVSAFGGNKCITCDQLQFEKTRRIAVLRGIEPHPYPDVPYDKEVYPNRHEHSCIYDWEWFTPDLRCEKCGTTAERHVEHIDQCHGCFSKLSLTARQEASAAGEKWYTPEKSCKLCGTLSPRYVANGFCKGCKPISDLKRPVMLTPRQKAMEAGEKWFTPLEPHDACGVIAPRYIANGLCKACVGLDDADRSIMEAGPCPRDSAEAIGIQVFTRNDGYWEWCGS